MAEQTTPTRIFKIGSNRIVENASTAGRSLEEVRAILKTAYPEVANATVRERVEGDTIWIEWLPAAGRKG